MSFLWCGRNNCFTMSIRSSVSCLTFRLTNKQTASMGTRKRPVAKNLCHSSIASGSYFGVDTDVCAETQREVRESRLGSSGGKRRAKNKSNRKKRSARRAAVAAQRRSCQLNVSPAGGLSQSKSENDLFEKSSKLTVDGGSSRLFPGYEGVVTSMRNLQFGTVVGDQSAMNDFSKTQILNTIALSREEVVLDEEEPGTADGREGHQSRITEKIRGGGVESK